jgi:hypothetical protein
MGLALRQNSKNRAGKLHLEFSVWRHVPEEFTATTAFEGSAILSPA